VAFFPFIIYSVSNLLVDKYINVTMLIGRIVALLKIKLSSLFLIYKKRISGDRWDGVSSPARTTSEACRARSRDRRRRHVSKWLSTHPILFLVLLCSEEEEYPGLYIKSRVAQCPDTDMQLDRVQHFFTGLRVHLGCIVFDCCYHPYPHRFVMMMINCLIAATIRWCSHSMLQWTDVEPEPSKTLSVIS